MAVVAERPQGLVPGVRAAANANPQAAAATVVTLTPADLPDRVEGWGPLDRLVWQDVSLAELSSAQLDALRGWIAGGGRLVLLGGTSGAATFNALPDELLRRSLPRHAVILAAKAARRWGEGRLLPWVMGRLRAWREIPASRRHAHGLDALGTLRPW